jgi:hypothetical protein
VPGWMWGLSAASQRNLPTLTPVWASQALEVGMSHEESGVVRSLFLTQGY